MVSIIMPAYNAEKYIDEAITSVIRQTYEEWELIVVDDGSKDKTEEIVLRYDDARIKYLKNGTNMGVSKSRNRGVEISRGEWIAFLDSDDMWDPEKLDRQLEEAKKAEGEFIFTGSAFVNEAGNRYSFELRVPERINYKTLLKQNVISCSSVLIKKDVIKKYPMIAKANIHEDFEVWLRILNGCNIEAVGVNEPLLIYRMHKNSKSSDKIKASIMTFNVYRELGLGITKSFYYWLCYIIKSLKKYSQIK